MNNFETLFCAALSNGAICTGKAEDRDLKRWFGDRWHITREEIAVYQASDYAMQALKYLQKIENRNV